MFSLFSTAQEISKDQIVKDFDYLYNTIKNSSITVDIFSEDYDISFENEYKKLRNSLLNNADLENLIIVSKKLFNISGDMHNHFVSSESLSSLLPYLPESEKEPTLERIDTSYFSESDENYKQVYNSYKRNKSCLDRIKTRYFLGNYLLFYDTEIEGVNIPYGSVIKKINGIKTNDFVNNRFINYFFKKEVVTNTFYTYRLFSGIFDDYDTICLSFKTENDIEINCTVNKNSKIDYNGSFLTLGFLNNVFYLKESKLLYITYTFLDYTDKLIKDLEKYKKKEIEKIVIDLGHNQGGSDLEWIKLMNYLSDTLFFQDTACFVMKNSDIMRKQFQNTNLENDNGTYLYMYNDILSYLRPNSDGFKFNKDFFIIIDNETFSSALSFANTSKYCDRIKLVGFESPYYGGFGVTPLYFMLPSSKLIYRLSSTTFDKKIFLTDSKSLEFDIKVTPSIKEFLDFRNKEIKRYKSKKYLIENNIFLKAINND